MTVFEFECSPKRKLITPGCFCAYGPQYSFAHVVALTLHDRFRRSEPDAYASSRRIGLLRLATAARTSPLPSSSSFPVNAPRGAILVTVPIDSLRKRKDARMNIEKLATLFRADQFV